MISFLLRNIASLEDNLKDARRKQHFARADSLRVQLTQARGELTKRLLGVKPNPKREPLKMTTLYKLTDADMRTHNGFQWKLNVRAKATGARGQGLCSSEFIHAYEHAEIAHVLNPIHANYAKPRLFRAEGKIEARDGQLKVGVRSLVLREEIVFQAPTTTQRVAFAVYCAKKVCRDQKWVAWADKWLSGEDRAARAAAKSAEWAARAAAESAESAARAAEWAAEWAARAAAEWAARAAKSAEWAARAAEWAEWAEWAAAESAESAPFSLRDCAIRALAFEVGELK